ncbi:Zinc finger and SCAN domain-containing protein 12, partial [Varanus komodoensis]
MLVAVTNVGKEEEFTTAEPTRPGETSIGIWTFGSRRESAGPSAKPKTPGLALPPTSQEAHRQEFRQSTILPGETPRETLTRLSDAAHRWLCPQESSKEQIVERIVLEQFLALLPVDMQGWFRAQGLGSSQEVAQLIETLLGEQEPAHVAKASNSEWALTEAKQKTFYWEATKENYENRASVVLQVSKEAMPQARASVGKESESRKLESTHPDSSSTSNDPDIIVVDVKEERDLWQEDSKEDGNEIVSDHRKHNKEVLIPARQAKRLVGIHGCSFSPPPLHGRSERE